MSTVDVAGVAVAVLAVLVVAALLGACRAGALADAAVEREACAPRVVEAVRVAGALADALPWDWPVPEGPVHWEDAVGALLTLDPEDRPR